MTPFRRFGQCPFPRFIVAISACAFLGGGLPVAAAVPENPAPSEVARELAAQARAHRIPEVLLDGLAWRESAWRQWDSSGKALESAPGHVGLLGVWAGGRADAARLRSDWRFNVAEGARQLEVCFIRAPIIGDGRLEDSRDILESWYFALGRYGDGHQNAASNRYSDGVLEAVASGGDGRWPGVAVNPLAAEDAQTAHNVLMPPVPWHFGGVAPRPASVAVVSLPVPYVSQVYDTPDDFAGGGACGPTSMTMVLAFFHKVSPRPIAVAATFPHTSQFGGLVPAVQSAVCEPNIGAVHAKMLAYIRPMLPGSALFYAARATRERVKAELDAGRPVILGTNVTSAGHIMVARGYLADGRFLVNDPAGDFYQAARQKGPDSLFAASGGRYWNGGGATAIYDWDAISVRWMMTFGPAVAPLPGDPPEDR
jgi:hypothetical protein